MSGLRTGSPIGAMLASRRADSLYFKINHSAVRGVASDAEDIKGFQDIEVGEVVQCRVTSLSNCQQYVSLRRDARGQLYYDTQKRTVREMPTFGEAQEAMPKRQSSFYGFGRSSPGKAPIDVERSTFKQERPQVLHKRGKRGAVKVRDTSIKTPKMNPR